MSDTRTHPVACNLCGSTNANPLFTAIDRMYGFDGQFQYVRCSCGLVYMNPQIAQEDLRHYYPMDYAPHQARLARAGRQPSYHNSLARVLDTMDADSRVLDVGCGSGEFLSQVRETLECHVTGVDISEHAAAVARNEYSLDVVHGQIFDVPLAGGTFDLITARSCIEHMSDPAAAVRAMHALCRPSGWLYLITPNFDSLAAKLWKDKWYSLDCPRHLYLFTPATIESLLTECGFADVKVYYEAAAKGWLGSMQYAIYGDNHRPEVKDKLRRSSLARAFISPLAHLSAVLKRADTIMVTARRRP
jgi:SAM-dependent methyltransferase